MSEQQKQDHGESELPLVPGHVMARDHYQRLLEQSQAEQK